LKHSTSRGDTHLLEAEYRCALLNGAELEATVTPTVGAA
jgi:hypothetical protein